MHGPSLESLSRAISSRGYFPPQKFQQKRKQGVMADSHGDLLQSRL